MSKQLTLFDCVSGSGGTQTNLAQINDVNGNYRQMTACLDVLMNHIYNYVESNEYEDELIHMTEYGNESEGDGTGNGTGADNGDDEHQSYLSPEHEREREETSGTSMSLEHGAVSRTSPSDVSTGIAQPPV